jgi:hypothetical protein
MNQQQLFLDIPQAPPSFDGQTYEAQFDQIRLAGQMKAVFDLMSDGKWRSLSEVHAIVGGSESGVGARTRDLRKKRWGSHTVLRRRREPAEAGLFEYKLIRNEG